MDRLIAYSIILIVLAWLAVRAARSHETDRWLSLLTQVFFLSLTAWVVSSLARSVLRDQGWVPGPLLELAGPAFFVGAACFLVMAFLLMLRAYRRQTT